MLNLSFRELKAADKSRRKTLWAASMARPLGMHRIYFTGTPSGFSAC
jgi:hypothetical protein